MLRDIISLGDRVEVTQLNHQGNTMRSVKNYISQVMDIIDHDMINIAMPIDLGKLILLHPGEGYSLFLHSNKGLYQCNCKVISHHQDNNIHIARVQIISDLKKIQRRQFYRFDCIIDMEYRIITPEESLLENKVMHHNFTNLSIKDECLKKLQELDQKWNKAIITDISGGGARFNSDYLHNKGDLTKIKVTLVVSGVLKKFILYGKLISSTSHINHRKKYEQRVEFKDISKKDREDIIKYIFEQERQRRKINKT